MVSSLFPVYFDIIKIFTFRVNLITGSKDFLFLVHTLYKESQVISETRKINIQNKLNTRNFN